MVGATMTPAQVKALLRRLLAAIGVAGATMLVLQLRKSFNQRLLKPPASLALPAKQEKSPSFRPRSIAVTGANGYLGSAIVEILLLRGHRVRACVRSEPTSSAYTFLNRAAEALNANGSFEIAGGCSLSSECAPAFQRAFTGVDTIVHTAMPMDNSGLVLDSSEYRRLRADLVAATTSVLEAASASSVKTFVLTSSSTAVIGTVIDGRKYDENDWSDKQPGTSAYGLLKAAVERAAVEWHAERGKPFRLVRICPPAIIGPSSAPAVNEFVKSFVTSPLTDVLKWSSVPQMRFTMCTLRDAAFAHALAVENEEADGRYCIGDQAMSATEWLGSLHAAGYAWPTYLTIHMPVPGPSWLVTPLFRRLMSSSIVAKLLGFGPDEVRGVLTILGTSKWTYDCSRAKRELAGPNHSTPPFSHSSVLVAGVEAARSLEARGLLIGRGGRVTPEGRDWAPRPWEAKYRC